MMRMSILELKNRIFKTIIIFTLIFVINIANVYASNVISNNADLSIINGPVVLNDIDLVVTGDSFAGKFYEYEHDKGLNIIPYARAGETIDSNKLIMAQALNLDYQNFLISIGVNDQFYDTPLYQFESVLRSVLNIAYVYNNNVIMHSYLMYVSDPSMQRRFAATNYNEVIERVVKEYPNVYYIDVHDLEKVEYLSDDNMHYNKKFYDELYNRVFNLLLKVSGGNY